MKFADADKSCRFKADGVAEVVGPKSGDKLSMLLIKVEPRFLDAVKVV